MKKRKRKKKGIVERILDFIENIPFEARFSIHDVAQSLSPDKDPLLARFQLSSKLTKAWRIWNRLHPETPLVRFKAPDGSYYIYFKTSRKELLQATLKEKQEKTTKRFLGGRAKDLELAEKLNITLEDHILPALREAILTCDQETAVKLRSEFIRYLPVLDRKAQGLPVTEEVPALPR